MLRPKLQNTHWIPLLKTHEADVTAPLTALEQLLADEIARRADAEQHLADYARRVVGVTPALHHRYICDELERGILNDEWDDCVICTATGRSEEHLRLATACRRGSSVTSPTTTSSSPAHTATLAEKWSRRVRDTVASPEHTRVFEHSHALARTARRSASGARPGTGSSSRRASACPSSGSAPTSV